MTDKFHYPATARRRRMTIVDAPAAPPEKFVAAEPQRQVEIHMGDIAVKADVPPPAPELPVGVAREPIHRPPAVRKVPPTLADALKSSPPPRAPPAPPPPAAKSAQERASMTNEETLNLLSAKAKALSDAFVLKVQRKRPLGGQIESVCTFEGATVNHFANLETWLPRLAGGGPVFLITGYHVDDPTMPIGGSLKFEVPVSDAFPAHSAWELDTSLPKVASWKGPTSMVWPTEDGKPKKESIPTIPSLSYSLGSSAAIQVPGVAAGTGSETERARFEMERMKFQEAKEQFDAERRKLELESIRREHEMRLREIESKVLAASTASAAPKSNLGDTIAAVMTAAAPFIAKLLDGQNEMRMLMFKAQEAQSANQNAMMQFYLNRPAIDPTLEKTIDRLQMFLEKSRENPAGNQMVQQMVDVMSTMTQTTMDMVSQAADLQLGGRQPGESPMIKAVREAVKAMGSMLTGYQVAAQAAPGAAPRQQLPQSPQSYAEAARAQPLPQQTGGPSNGHHNQPGSQAFAQAAEPNGRYGVLENLEAAIKGHRPVVQVAELFLKSLRTPEMVAALAECDNQINELIARRLGSWMAADAANQAYFTQLMNEVGKQGEKMGVFEDEGGEEEDEDEDDYEQEDA